MGGQWLSLLLLCFFVLACNADLKLQNVDRKINLNSQFARVTETIRVKNTGTSAESNVILCTLAKNAEKLAYQKIVPASVPNAPAEASCVEIALTTPVPGGETTSLESFSVYADMQKPYPAEIMQVETQLMTFSDNLYVVSPYQVSAQSTEVTLPNSNVKSYTEEKPSLKTDNKIKYGKYDLIKPFTIKELRVHYESKHQFKTVTSLVREIEVSHWGNIYVEESYELKNAGAKHKGPFSRLKYAHSYNGKGNAISELRARLPGAAHSLYYNDIIGNISSSDVRKTSAETIIDFAPRYPLMGGWKVDFKLGYSVPLEGFLFKKRSDGKHRLIMDFSTSVEDIYIEDLVVKVVLPEGSSHINVSLPFDVEKAFDTKYTYLDTSGRPVLVLHKSKVVPEHATTFSVDYSFGRTSLLREPLLLIGAFVALFAAGIIYNRLEFTISKDDKWEAAQAAEKLTTVMQQISAVIEEQQEVLSDLGKLTSSIRSPEDAEQALNGRSMYDNALVNLDNKIRPLLKSVETSPRVAAQLSSVLDKLRALQLRYQKQLTDRADLIKKGMSMLEVNKRMVPTGQQLAEAKREVEAQLDILFEPY